MILWADWDLPLLVSLMQLYSAGMPISLEGPSWPSWHGGQLVPAVGWSTPVLLHMAAHVRRIDFLTWRPQGKSPGGWRQKLQGPLRPSLQNSHRVALNTFYESRQDTGQPRFKRWGHRLHLLMEGATKKLWPCFSHHRKLLAHINGKNREALSLAASRCSQHIIRNRSLSSLSFVLLCAGFILRQAVHSSGPSDHQPL